MPDGKVIPFAPGEYPELNDLPAGTKVNFQGTATIVEQGGEEGGEGEGSMGLQIDQIELDPEGEASRELKNMTKQDQSYATPEGKASGF